MMAVVNSSQAQAVDHTSEMPRQHLRLSRRPVVLCTAAIVAILLLTGLGLRAVVRHYVLQDAQDDSVRIAAALRTVAMEALVKIEPDGQQRLVIDPRQLDQLDQRMRAFLASFDVVKIKVFTPDTEIIYSSDRKIIGQTNPDNLKLQAALRGEVVSLLKKKDSIWDLADEERFSVSLLETYLPVVGSAGQIIGSVEIYQDVTSALRTADKASVLSTTILGATLLAVFAALSLMPRAGGISAPRVMPKRSSHEPRSAIRIRLTVAFGTVLGVCMVLAAVVALSAWWVGRDLQQITETELQRVDAAMEMEINTLGTGLAVAQYLHDQQDEHLERIAKDRADFNRAWDVYHQLAEPGSVEAELADQAQQLYQRFREVGDELIATDRRILAQLGTVGDRLRGIDTLLDEKLQPTADSDELRLLMAMEIDVNELTRRFNAYLTTDDEAALSESLAGDEREFRQDLATLQALPLSQQEQGWVKELERLFDKVVAAHQTIHQDKQLLDAGVEEFGRLRIALDDLLDDAIQQRAVEDIRSASSAATSRMKVFTLTAVALTAATLLLLAPILRLARQISDTERRLREREQQLRHDALHDSLTGLSNRSLLNDRIEDCIKRSKRHRNYRFALLFLDLDRFKVVNDSLGHTVGDQLLVAIAKRLDRCLRSMDTVARADGEVLARLGGDEFVILLDDIRDDTDASHVAERVLAELSPAFQLAGHEITASASIGIALSGSAYDRAEYMLRDADTAMYHAKAAGRSRYQVFDKPMHERAVKHLQLESDLRRALEQQQFELHYQPIVSLKTARITGFEALIRWNHPERGLVSPADFIPLAEETGLIVPIGRWVLHEACRQVRAWQEHCPPDQSLSININISKRQVSEGNLARDVTKVLRRTGIDSRCLKLEITETVIMENHDSIMAVLEELKELGVQLHMDDFGTGHSSLTHLHRFPLDVLKIDRAFLENLQGNLQYAAVVHAVVTLAHNLDMEVTAEGIETSEQLAQIIALDCDYGQGYLFSKPLVAAEAEAIIGKQFLVHQAA